MPKLKDYALESLMAFTLSFMVYYPPKYGVALYALALAIIAAVQVLKHLERKESPDLRKLKDDVKDLKTKVEQLVLRGQR
jgi:hypothetical protein